MKVEFRGTGPGRMAVGAALLGSSLAAASPASAQTDYYNTDSGRPVRIEDAYPTERYAFELQLAPVRLERVSSGVYSWEVEPEIAYGILPRTQVEVGFPIAVLDGPEGRTSGLGGIEISALHNLNVETALPAFGIAAEATLPVGGLAPGDLYPSVKAIATRTFSWARFHVNARFTFGLPAQVLELGPDAAGHEEDVSRWLAGVAVDHVLPLRATLLTAEVWAAQPVTLGSELEWNTGAGVRYQMGPRLAIDAGLGRRITGRPHWFLTFGSAYAFAVRSLIPVRTADASLPE